MANGQLLYYKCMTPTYLESFLINPNLKGGSDDIEFKVGAGGTEYQRLLTVPLLPRSTKPGERDDLTITINVAAEGPKPSYYDPLSVCITDGDQVMGIQLRDPSEYTDKKLGPYMSAYGGYGFSLVNPVFKPSTEGESNFAYERWRRWPQMFNIRIKPNPTFAQPWGLCSSSINGGISLSFDYPRQLDVNNDLSLTLFRFKPTEKYTINMIEVAIYKDAS